MAKKINRDTAGEASKKKASTAYKVGDCLTVDASGFMVPGGEGSVKGVCLEQITSADSDYASTRDLVFQGFDHEDQFEFPVITGTATQAMVGTLVDLDDTDPRGLDVTATDDKQVEITRFISASLVWGRFVPQVA